MQTDVIVLGAGMVGISSALHLQAKGRSVALIDRRGAAEETSFGNTGLIQSEGIVPYPFPRDFGKAIRYALNLNPEAHVHWTALPRLAPMLYRYWVSSESGRLANIARAFEPLAHHCLVEHEALMGEAGITSRMRRTGYLRLYRTVSELDIAEKADAEANAAYGVNYRRLAESEIRELEPHLKSSFVGAIYMPDPVSVDDPGAVGKAYAELFVRRGGRFLRGEARTLDAVAGGWKVETSDGPVSARDALIALGAWSSDVLVRLGIRIPLFVKRGYHMHYGAEGNATLSRPVVDSEAGYAITATPRGIRLTTGAEFARRDAAPTPVQLGKVEPMARRLFPLTKRVDPAPWLGARPCLPDMLPVIGRAPRNGLWLNFGHHHWGFTQGPVSGRLLAEIMTGDTPFTDPAPYRADRFW
jgi:D-amino-acid dehydrogenase